MSKSTRLHFLVLVLDSGKSVRQKFIPVGEQVEFDIWQGKLSFHYTGKGNHVHDVGAVQANRPFAVNELVGYFELRIICAGQRGNIMIGLANQDFNVMRHPGKDSGSYGFQGDDGRKFEDNGSGEPYGPKFGADDVVGCGLHFGTREIFFTKNGQHLGVAFRCIGHSYYPTVGLHSEGEAAVINFGAQPFVFPISTLIREEETKFSNSISRLQVEGSTLHELVRQYLHHHGNMKTLEFLPAVGSEAHVARRQITSVGCPATDEDPKCQETCQLLRQLIECGNSSAAIDLLATSYPSFLSECHLAQAMLMCQVMIEHLDRGDLGAAVLYAKNALGPLVLGLDVPDSYHCGGGGWHDMHSSEKRVHGDGACSAGKVSMMQAIEYTKSAITLLATCEGQRRREGDESRGYGRSTSERERPPQPRLPALALNHLHDPEICYKVPSEYEARRVGLKCTTLLREYVGEEGRSKLERLMQHMMAAHASLRILQGGRGEALTLSSVLELKRLV